jgi:hypothetical protein
MIGQQYRDVITAETRLLKGIYRAFGLRPTLVQSECRCVLPAIIFSF